MGRMSLSGLILVVMAHTAAAVLVALVACRTESAYPLRGGEIFAELDLLYDRQIDVPGPLGVTRLEVRARRVRVVSDPGPRQYCVLQGWLSRAGEVAVCAPNQVSVLVLGRKEVYDSLSY